MKYGKPPIGCYIEQANYNIDDLNRRVIAIAQDLGWPTDDDDQATINAYDNRDDDEERSNGPDMDLWEALEYIAEDAIEWLNEQETRSFLCWYHSGDAGAFGLWPDVDGAKDDVGFVSVRSLADARSLGIETDPEDSEYPPADYEGEWLHVNCHGNATLYVRSAGKDTEIWSIV